MAPNPDFLKVVTDIVTLQYPRLDQPYRYNPAAKKSEPCLKTAPNAGYSITWTVSRDDAKVLHTLLKEHHTAVAARSNGKVGAFGKVFGMKKNEDGTVNFTAKRTAMKGDGSENRPPTVVGPDLQELADKAIWSGSQGRVRAWAYPSRDPQTNEWGISMMLDTVQVTDAVYGGDTLADDFGPAITTPASTPLDPFADDPPRTAGNAGPGLERGVPFPDEDELPFN